MWTLALIYIALPLYVAIESQLNHIKAKRAFWFIAADFASDSIAFLLFVGYWWKGIVQQMSGLAPYLFLFSIFWRVGVSVHTWRFKWSETDRQVLHQFGPVRVIFVFLFLMMPVFLFAGLAAFRRL